MSDGEVVVLGGGVIGCIVARILTPEYDVTVLERGQIASEASALAAGLVTIALEYGDVPAIGSHAMSFFRRFDGTEEFSFTGRESVEPITPDREVEARRSAAAYRERGVNVAVLEPETIRERYPRYDVNGVACALHSPKRGGSTRTPSPRRSSATPNDAAQRFEPGRR